MNRARAVHGRAVAFGEVVVNRDLVPRVEQFFRANGPDITGAAGDENVHGRATVNAVPLLLNGKNRSGRNGLWLSCRLI